MQLLKPWKRKRAEANIIVSYQVFPELPNLDPAREEATIYTGAGDEEFQFTFGPGSQGYSLTPELLRISVPAGKYLEGSPEDFPAHLVGALSAAAGAAGFEPHTVEYLEFPQTRPEKTHRVEIGAEGEGGQRIVLSRKGDRLELAFENYAPLAIATEILVATLMGVADSTRLERAIYRTVDKFSRTLRLPEGGHFVRGEDGDFVRQGYPSNRDRPPLC